MDNQVTLKAGDAVVVIFNGHAMDAVVVSGPRVMVKKYGQKVPVYQVRITAQDGGTKVREYAVGAIHVGVARTDVSSPRSRSRERRARYYQGRTYQAQVAQQPAQPDQAGA